MDKHLILKTNLLKFRKNVHADISSSHPQWQRYHTLPSQKKSTFWYLIGPPLALITARICHTCYAWSVVSLSCSLFFSVFSEQGKQAGQCVISRRRYKKVGEWRPRPLGSTSSNRLLEERRKAVPPPRRLPPRLFWMSGFPLFVWWAAGPGRETSSS